MSTNTTEIQPGTIFVSSWGYDQTTVDFFEVISATAKTVQLRPIAKDRGPESRYMSDEVTPKPGEYIGEPIRRKLQPSNFVSINSFAIARVWDGRPKTQTHYA